MNMNLDLERLSKNWKRKHDPDYEEVYTIRYLRTRTRFYPKTERAYSVMTFSVDRAGGESYRVALGFPLEGPDRMEELMASPGARVGCTCPDFHYREAYWFLQRDWVYPRLGWGKAATQPPLKTNPQGELRVCKHIKMVWELVKDRDFSDIYRRSLKVKLRFRR